MINFNGNLQETKTIISFDNRGYKYGDALFETLKVINAKILFWEDHYFRLMSSMRILRMEIPMEFTMEFLENEILKTIVANKLSKNSVRVRLNIDRGEGGKYLPVNENVNYSIIVEKIPVDFYMFNDETYRVDLYKDYFVAPGLLSNLKTNNKVLHVLGSIYAKENDLDNCILLNTNKNVIEVLNGNLFLVKDNVIKTAPLIDGCLNGVMRKQVIKILNSIEGYSFVEASISPFELQQAEELFITNVIVGIQPITDYRKKVYKKSISVEVVKRLNTKIRLS